MQFWHSYRCKISDFDIENHIFTFGLPPNIVFWHSQFYFDIQLRSIVAFWHSQSYCDIQIKAEYRILTFTILFLHSNLCRISHFDIQYLIFTFGMGWISNFDIHDPFLDIPHEAEYRILTFKITFWHSKQGRISYFDIQNAILTIKMRPNIVIWRSTS